MTPPLSADGRSRKARRRFDVLEDDRVTRISGGTAKDFVVRSPLHVTPWGRPTPFNVKCFEPFGEILAPRLVESFLSHIDTGSTRTHQTYTVGIRRVFTEAGKVLKDISPEGLRRAFDLAASAIKNDPSLEPSSAHSYILNANLFLAHCQAEGVLPDFALPAGVRNVWLAQRSKDAISEIFPTFVGPGLPPGLEASDAKVQALWWKLSELTEITEPTIMIERLELLLRHVREFAQRGLRAHWAQHQAAIQDISFEKYQEVISFMAANSGRTSRSRGPGRGSVSVLDDIPSILSYVEFKYHGFPPNADADPALYRLISKKHSHRDIKRSLHLTIDTSLYYLVIILLEAVLNISNALDLNRRSLRVINEELGTYELTWYKARSDGKRHPRTRQFSRTSASTLDPACEDDVTLVEAVQCLAALQHRLSRFAPSKQKGHLFLVGDMTGARGSNGTERVATLTEHLEGKAWKRLSDADPIMRLFPMTLDQLRTSILLLAFLRTKGNILLIQELADHADISVSARYVDRTSSRLQGVAHVREVQSLVTVLATTKLPEVRAKLGLTQRDEDEILGRARRKGFGSWTIGKNTPEGDASDAYSSIERWLIQSEHIVISDDLVAAEIIAFRDHIKAERINLLPTSAWGTTWAPLLIYLNMIIDKFAPDLRVSGRALADQFEIVFEDLD